jgi:uncharacterized protein (TIGR03083 family)
MDSTVELLGGLDEHEWATASLCPGWTVRDVVVHLAGIEEMLLGWRPDGDAPAPFDQLRNYLDFAARATDAEILTRFVATLDARRAELADLGEDDFSAVSWTPIGVATYGRFMEIRAFDFWVHEQDMRVPLAHPGHLVGGAAELAIDEVRRTFGYIVGKSAAVPDGRSVAVRLTGPVHADLCAVVDGRARVVDALEHADAEMITDSLTFALLACGRIDPEATLADGRVELRGDLELAHRLATNLRFTR